MRILFVMASPEYLRFYDSAVRGLAERGHDVLLAVNQQQDEKPVRLEELGSPERIRILGLVPPRGDAWYPMARAVRGTMDYLRYLHPRYADAPALRTRLARKGLPYRLRGIDTRLGVWTPRSVDRAIRGLAAVETGIPPSASIGAFLDEHRPDIVIVSPLVDVASDQVDVVRAARQRGIRVAVAVASWDNLTNKGLLRVQPDALLVWNEAQKREAAELHGVPPERVVVTGAQLFDKWFQRTPSRSLDAFASDVGLRRADRFLLFTGSSMFISAPEKEVPFVQRWVAAVRSSPHAALRDVPILVRPHPYNGWIWADVDMSGFADVAVWPRGKYNPVDAANRNDFFDSLYYSRAVVGINTSAMIEAAIIGRPVHSIVTGDFASTQEGTLHFHHLLPENGGFLQVGRGFDHHLELLAASLADEAAARAQTERFVSWFLRPRGLDRDCTPIFAEGVEQAAGWPVVAPERAGVMRAVAWLLRPVIAVLAHRPAKASDRQRRALRKQLDAANRRARKRIDKTTKITVKRLQRVRKAVAGRLRAFGV
ncbi:MAG: hypothetical protein AB7P99_02900 [Vicinamibacterales bacterium]